jgi:alkanesulfonate monooxygenase SsuD/methylene tetrahydromethanopterin reductase-like flavin-dependent oxidoreductase (luciferase family)
MAIYQILYWQDIPSQVKAWDDFDEVKISLAPRFMEQIDQVAQRKGLTNTDDYLAQWNWSEKQERAGDPDEVAEKIKGELEAKS